MAARARIKVCQLLWMILYNNNLICNPNIDQYNDSDCYLNDKAINNRLIDKWFNFDNTVLFINFVFKLLITWVHLYYISLVNNFVLFKLYLNPNFNSMFNNYLR